MNRSSSAKARKPFKPPSRLGTVPGVKAPVGHKPGAEKVVNIADALEREAEVDEEIRRLEEKGFRREQLQEYINLMHRYNEVKDVAQMFMGRLAVYEGVRCQDIAVRYNAPDSH